MLHHVLLEVADLQRSGAFYDALLAPLGWRRHFDDETVIGWGIAKPVFFVAANHPPQPGFGMVSFSASGIAAVKASWEGACAAGGSTAAEPGTRRAHGSGPYSAFLKDPDGYDVEVTVGAD